MSLELDHTLITRYITDSMCSAVLKSKEDIIYEIVFKLVSRFMPLCLWCEM